MSTNDRLTQNQETNRTRRFNYTENTNTLTGIKYFHRVDENTTNVTKELVYSYDKMGNIIQDEKHAYTYDSRNRLTAIDDNVSYNYNYDNRRVSKTVNGTTTYFIYEGHRLLGEYDANGNVLNEYIYLGSTPIAMSTNEKTYKIYTDHLNTPRRVADESNNIVWKWESTPFGETKPIGTLEFNLRFAGQYFDNETATHYNINRDYNPITGRYIQSDPIGLDGGLSTFAYVNGNPVMLVDLEGLFGSQVAPTPVFVDRRGIYLALIERFIKDLKTAYYVDSEIRNLGFGQAYNSAYSSDSPGYESRAKAIRSQNLIIYYRSTWENSNGSVRYRSRARFLETAFHEIQHLRQDTNTHTNPFSTTSSFGNKANEQYLNFLSTADGNYWGAE